MREAHSYIYTYGHSHADSNTNTYCYRDSCWYWHSYSYGYVHAQATAAPAAGADRQAASHPTATPVATCGRDGALSLPIPSTGSPSDRPSTRERATDAVQAFGEHFRVHAHADTEMIRHFEKATGYC